MLARPRAPAMRPVGRRGWHLGRDCLPYQYGQFCELYAAWRDQRRHSMFATGGRGGSSLLPE